MLISMAGKIKSFLYAYKFSYLRRLYKIPRSTILEPGFNVQQNGDYRRLSIGEHCHLSCNLYFERSNNGKVTIQNRVHIGGNTKLISISEIYIGSDVTIAWDCTIYDHDSHSIEWELRQDDTLQEISDLILHGNSLKNKNWEHVHTKPIRIEDKVWIGFGVTILKGVTIGSGSVVGAKSVVTRDIPPNSLVAGNPARVIRAIR